MSLITNGQLFSEVYLRELLAGKHAVDVLEGSRTTIRDWREEYRMMDFQPERVEYARQALVALGASTTPRPDGDGLTLFTDASKVTAAGLCLVVGESDLGQAIKGAHPQARLIRELRKDSLRWGIITNGSQWRLCYAAAAAPYEVYLEADLDSLLREPGLREFFLFHRFFGGGAFSAEGDKLGLDRFLGESEKRTEAIERHLKSQVEPILQKLCLGFVEDEGAGYYSPETLQVIYQNAIYLLYRILFLFYAEARGLLPVETEAYRPASLAALVESARQQVEGEPGGDSHGLWTRLTRLFVVVDDGDDSLGVAAYNGGLFSDTEKPYLKSHRIRNEYLAPALFALGFEASKAGPQPIDYRDLSVRHLGTLYEGLLEYRLNRVEDEPRVVRENGGKRVFLPVSQAGPVKRSETLLEVGQVYFADDKGERKASGSYYTPEDVVQYIIANTLTPKLVERRTTLDRTLADVGRERAIAPTADARQQLERYADAEAARTVDREILGLRVLDPAMGSGHFLVAATQTMTDFIVETLNATDWPDETLSTDPIHWKRRVVERSIYGVDKNPLAHELAKLSLWIASASAGKPLTFLDHHLKCGNSLYGTPLTRLGSLPSVKNPVDDPLFRVAREETIRSVLKELAEVTAADSDTIGVVKQKGELNRSARTLTDRIRAASDLWLATLFGLKRGDGSAVSQADYGRVLNDITINYAPETWARRMEEDTLLSDARRIAEEEHFFHWELEFPDSIVKDACRFDVVVANPPYVGTKPNAAIAALYETAKSSDLYAWMLERGLRLTGTSGQVGTVVPLSIMFGFEMRPLRTILLSQGFSTRIACFDNVPEGLFNTGKVSDNSSKENMQRTAIVLSLKTPGKSCLETTGLLRWWCQDRALLFPSLRYADVTAWSTAELFPHCGESLLWDFWKRLARSDLRVADVAQEVMYEGRKPKKDEISITVPRAVGYFISATPGPMARSKTLSATFRTPHDCDVVRVLINSNVFFWYWRTFGDGFLLSVDIIKNFPVPETCQNEMPVSAWAAQLDEAHAACITFKMYRGERIPSCNFNKRMDLLLDIDDWIVRQIAPGLKLPRGIFAQYKSNSFMRPLDFSALASATEPGEDG